VKPYVKTIKSDYIDAAAITEVVAGPTMRPAPIKTDKQLDMQPLPAPGARTLGNASHGSHLMSDSASSR
jgi:hypothetical protein